MLLGHFKDAIVAETWFLLLLGWSCALVTFWQGFRSSSNLPVVGLDVIRQVEAKHPALLFKMQLTAYVEKIYGMIRDNTKKELSNVLALCVQVKWNITCYNVIRLPDILYSEFEKKIHLDFLFWTVQKRHDGIFEKEKFCFKEL